MKITGIPSRTDPGVLYEIVFEDSEPICDCPGYQFTGGCYHADAARGFVAGLRRGGTWKARAYVGR